MARVLARACFLFLASLFAASPWLTAQDAAAQDADTTRHAPARPNVLFIVLDDMNDWTDAFSDAHPIRTPALRRLAERGMFFRHAYAPSPSCNPSRAAILTGMNPSSTGVYGNTTDWRAALPDAVTLPRYFLDNGYAVEGAGKIFHHGWNSAYHDDDAFERFLKMPWLPDAPPAEKLNGIANWVGGRDGRPTSAPFDWGPRAYTPERPHPDVRTVNWVIDRLEEEASEPFFLAAGLFRPHMPFYAPQAYFDAYPPGAMPMPAVYGEDVRDIPSGGQKLLAEGKPFILETIRRGDPTDPYDYYEAVRAYAAASTFADAQVGRLLDALEASPHADSTIVVLWSDHGYHLGEKDHWEKFVLWEKATHVPFVIAAPWMDEGVVVDRPVSLVDLYPTLLDLCGLPPKEGLDGKSLVPLMRDPDAAWDRPALMTYGYQNHALRDGDWRYIRYADGTEELYNLKEDPYEWYNVAADPEHAAVIDRLKARLPEENAPPAPDMEKPEGITVETTN